MRKQTVNIETTLKQITEDIHKQSYVQ